MQARRRDAIQPRNPSSPQCVKSPRSTTTSLTTSSFAENTVWNGGCKSYYKLGDKVIATFPGTTTEFWWKTRNPVWESYLQMGGTRRMAVRHRGGQLLKSLAMIALVVLFQRLGYKKIKNQSMLFLVVRTFVLAHQI